MAIGGGNAPSDSKGNVSWLQQYTGDNEILKDEKSKDVPVKVGEYVYNNYGNIKIEGEPYVEPAHYGLLEITTPIQVVNQSYSTVGNSGRRLVRLNNGDLVCVLKDASDSWHLYKSTDNSTTWEKIVSLELPFTECCIATDGTYIYHLRTTTTSVFFRKYDNMGNQIGTQSNLDVLTTVETCSLVIDSNGHVHACWSGKTPSHSISNNIRYSKSTDEGVTWDAVTLITTDNLSGYNNTSPCIVTVNNLPIIVFQVSSSQPYKGIYAKVFEEGTSNWLNKIVYAISENKDQAYPTVDVLSDGTVIVAWRGIDSNVSTTKYNILFSQSVNNGATWSAMENITNDTVHSHYAPSITRDENDIVHIVWQCQDTTGYYQIKQIKGSAGNWEDIQTITDVSGVSGARCPSTINNYRSFEKPLLIYQDSSSNQDVKFYGSWETDVPDKTITPIQIIPAVTDVQSSEELKATISGVLKLNAPILKTVYEGFKSKENLRKADMQGEGTVKILDTLVKEYEIEAGANINAGDLVDFINNKAIPCNYNSFDNGTTQTLAGIPTTAYIITAIRVSETGIILCYGNPSMTYPYAIGLRILDGVITVSNNPLVLNYNTVASLSPGYKVSENVGVITFTISSSYMTARLLKLEDDLSVTAKGSYGATVTHTLQCGMFKPISSTRGVIVYVQNTNQFMLRYFSIDDNDFTLTELDYKLYTAPYVSYTYTALESIDNINFVCFTHESNSRRMDYFTFSIQDEVIVPPTALVLTNCYMESTYGIDLVKQNNFIGLVGGGWNQDVKAYALIVDCSNDSYPYSTNVISTSQLIYISSAMINNGNFIMYRFDYNWNSSILTIVSLYNVKLLYRHVVTSFNAGQQVGSAFFGDMGFMFNQSQAYQFFTYKGAKGIAKENGVGGETKKFISW